MDKSAAEKYIKHNLNSLQGMHSMDANHLTCVYFLVTAAKLLQLPLETPQKIIDWILSMQLENGFFTGSPLNSLRMPHLANTYTALALLLQLTPTRADFLKLIDP